jgi:aspartyl-tRNA(Asn)/glutamyl-tRNA(Gln) amidotransferase subunit A
MWERIHPDVQRLVEAAASSLARNGGILEQISLPNLSAAVDAANLMSIAEATTVHEQAGYFPARTTEYGEDVGKRLGMGRDIHAIDYLKARATVEQAKKEFAAALQQVDAIVAPTVAVTAPKIGTETVRIGSTEEPMRAAMLRLTRPGNLTGLPNVTVPCGFTREGLPVGMQLIGPAFGEANLLAIARTYEQENDWAARHPPSAA